MDFANNPSLVHLERVIIEAAALAAWPGAEIQWLYDQNGLSINKSSHPWNPIHNASDSARLQAVLQINTLWTDNWVQCGRDKSTYATEFFSHHNMNKEFSHRLATAKAAANLNKREIDA